MVKSKSLSKQKSPVFTLPRFFGGDDDDVSYSGSFFPSVHSLVETSESDLTDGSDLGLSHSNSSSDVSADMFADFDSRLKHRHMIACQTMQNGHFEQAIQMFGGIVKALRGQLDSQNPRVTTALHNLGIANLRGGNFSAAKRVMEETIDLRSTQKDPKLADSLVEIGIIELARKEYADGIEAFVKALKIREDEAKDLAISSDITDNQLKVAKIHNNLGCALYERGDMKDAATSFDRSVRIQKKVLIPFFLPSPDPKSSPGFLTLASTLCNRGYADIKNDDYSQALRVFSESLDIQRSLLRPDDKMTLETLDCVAFCFLKLQSLKEALANYQDICTYQKTLGSVRAKERARSLRKVIYCELKLRKYDHALRHLRLLEDVQTDAFGHESAQVDETLLLMGQVNYHVLKLPTLGIVGFDCFCGGSNSHIPVIFHHFKPLKPRNSSKLSGHRITCP